MQGNQAKLSSQVKLLKHLLLTLREIHDFVELRRRTWCGDAPMCTWKEENVADFEDLQECTRQLSFLRDDLTELASRLHSDKEVCEILASGPISVEFTPFLLNFRNILELELDCIDRKLSEFPLDELADFLEMQTIRLESECVRRVPPQESTIYFRNSVSLDEWDERVGPGSLNDGVWDRQPPGSCREFCTWFMYVLKALEENQAVFHNWYGEQGFDYAEDRHEDFKRRRAELADAMTLSADILDRERPISDALVNLSTSKPLAGSIGLAVRFLREDFLNAHEAVPLLLGDCSVKEIRVLLESFIATLPLEGASSWPEIGSQDHRAESGQDKQWGLEEVVDELGPEATARDIAGFLDVEPEKIQSKLAKWYKSLDAKDQHLAKIPIGLPGRRSSRFRWNVRMAFKPVIMPFLRK